jgi:hypothetical protein
MKRSFFLLGLACALTAVSLRIGIVRRTPLERGAIAGRCADQHRSRWSGYTAADFS